MVLFLVPLSHSLASLGVTLLTVCLASWFCLRSVSQQQAHIEQNCVLETGFLGVVCFWRRPSSTDKEHVTNKWIAFQKLKLEESFLYFLHPLPLFSLEVKSHKH